MAASSLSFFFRQLYRPGWQLPPPKHGWTKNIPLGVTASSRAWIQHELARRLMSMGSHRAKPNLGSPVLTRTVTNCHPNTNSSLQQSPHIETTREGTSTRNKRLEPNKRTRLDTKNRRRHYRWNTNENVDDFSQICGQSHAC